MAKRATILLMILVPVLLPACIAPKGGDRKASRIEEPWPFAPVRLEIHPLTRYIRAAPNAAESGTIEAHIELFDRDGDPAKGVGVLLIELYRMTGPVEGVGAEEQIARWPWNLNDPEKNKATYDPVTRTYRMSLTGLPPSTRTGESLELRATLTVPDGRAMTDRYRLRLEGQTEPRP